MGPAASTGRRSQDRAGARRAIGNQAMDRVSRKYLQPYVNKFAFRYNNRENPDIFDAAIEAC